MSDFAKDTNVPTNDCISRQEAIDAIQKLNMPEDMCVFEIVSHIEAEIATLPSAEPKTAVWIGEYDGYADGNVVIDNWYCSNCDYCYEDFEKPEWNYCPNCGAKMEVTE